MGTAMRAVPKRFRFVAAIRIAEALSLMIGRTDMYLRSGRSVETLEENTLSHVLDMMTRSGTLFDLELELEGLEDLESAIARGHGVFIATVHASLNTLLIRQLHDIGCRPHVIAVDTRMLIPGTTKLSGNCAPSDGFMFGVRSRLRAGGVACAMIDRVKAGRRTIDAETPAGLVIVSHALFRVAERVSASVFFVHVCIQSGKVKMIFKKATEDGGSVPAEMATQHFVDFMQAHVPKQC